MSKQETRVEQVNALTNSSTCLMMHNIPNGFMYSIFFQICNIFPQLQTKM
jgi:hypothetical protein